MKRFLALTLLVAMLALLITPTTAEAKAAPGLVLKTPAISMTFAAGPFTPPVVKTPITFANMGSVPMRWWIFAGSDFGGCAIESPVKWLTIAPNAGMLAPRATIDSVVAVDPHGLESGVHNVNLCLLTNDPFHGETLIPLTITVK